MVRGGEIDVFGGASMRLQGYATGRKRAQRCSGAQRAAVCEREGASSRGWPALPLPGRRVQPFRETDGGEEG